MRNQNAHELLETMKYIRVCVHCANGPVLHAYLSEGALVENLRKELSQRFCNDQMLISLKNYRILKDGTYKENGLENDDIIIVLPPTMLKKVIFALKKLTRQSQRRKFIGKS